MKEQPDSIRIGVTNSEFEDTAYRVVLYSEGRPIFQQRLRLSVGERWSALIDVSSIPRERRSFDARLIKNGDPSLPYREATLVLPGSKIHQRPMSGSCPARPTEHDAAQCEQRGAKDAALPGRAPGPGDVYEFSPRPANWRNVEKDDRLASIPPGQRSFEAFVYRSSEPPVSAPYRSASLDLRAGY